MNTEPEPLAPMARRANKQMARVIDIGLSYKAMLGYPRAQAYLCDHGVPDEIIKRVLSDAGEFRGIDSDTEDDA